MIWNYQRSPRRTRKLQPQYQTGQIQIIHGTTEDQEEE